VIFEHSTGPRPDAIWLAQLDQRRGDGSYPLTALLRSDWEKRGLAERNARVTAERPAADAAPPGPAALGVDAIIYGADWCKPCHLAEDYLKKRGARVVKKDIEEDPAAGSEMRRKLQSAGLGGSGIPVLDIGGTLLVGFSESAIDAALRRSGK
jgi:glutaredoxin